MVFHARMALFCLMLCVLYLPASDFLAKESAESFTVNKHFAVSDMKNRPGGWAQTIFTHNEVIYAVWVDVEFRTMIARIPPSGKITTNVIFESTDEDNHHNLPVIGVDKYGYIHVAGNMHGSPWGRCRAYRTSKAANPCYQDKNEFYDYPWQYVVSDKPEDISSFSFHGDDAMSPPGTWISYPYFARDRNKELYVSFRHRVKFGGWTAGSMALGLARYDADNRRWTALGGRDYEHGADVVHGFAGRSHGKTFFWENAGYKNTAYQGYKARMFFDKNNRMHLSFGANDGTNTANSKDTHIMYAYSDDGGETFRRSNGSLFETLPIRLDTADVVVPKDFRKNGYNIISFVGVDPDGHPLITFQSYGESQSFITTYRPGHGWSYPKPIRTTWARMITDQNGVMTVVYHRSLFRSKDAGQSWTKYRASGVGHGYDIVFDEQYHQETGKLRFFDMKSGVYTLVDPESTRLLAEDDRVLQSWPKRQVEPSPPMFDPWPGLHSFSLHGGP